MNLRFQSKQFSSVIRLVRILILLLSTWFGATLAAEPVALAKARAALLKAEQEKGVESREAAICLNDLAVEHELLEQYEEAETLYRRSLAIREKVLGEDRGDEAASLANLVSLLRQRGKEKEAEPRCRHLLRLRQKIFGDSSLEVAACLGCLGDLLAELDKHGEAIDAYKELLKIHEDLAGLPERAVAEKLKQSMDIHRLTKQGGGQQPLFRSALQTHEDVLGHDHADLGDCYSLVANILSCGGGSPELQEEILRRALEIRTATLGARHPLTVKIEYRLAGLLKLHWNSSRRPERLTLYRHCLPVMEKAAGVDAESTFSCREAMARLLVDTGHSEEALPLTRQVLEKIEQRGVNDRKLVHALGDLAFNLYRLRRDPEATDAYHRQLNIAEKCYTPGNSDFTHLLYTTAHYFEYMERWQEALPLWRRKLAIEEKSMGPERASIAAPLRDLSRCLHKLGELSEAEQLSRRSLKIAETKNYELGSALKQLADVLHARQNLEEAAVMYHRAYLYFMKTYGPNDWSTKRARESYAKVLRQMTDPETVQRKIQEAKR